MENIIKELNNIKVCKYLNYGMGEDFEGTIFCENTSADPSHNFYYENLKCKECPDFEEIQIGKWKNKIS